MQDADKPTPETDLDESLQIAMEDKSKASFFYDGFLNTDLYMPVQLEDAEGGNWRCLEIDERFYPLFLKFEQGQAVPVFDTLDRLQTWAEDHPLDYLQIPGYTLLQIISANLFILLNLGTSWTYTFTPDVLDKLRTAARPVQPV